MTHEDLIRIGQVAAETGVSIDTIRYYERLRLLPQAPRTRGGFRLYSRDQLRRLRAILEAKRLGLSLKQIRGIFDPETPCPRMHCEAVREVLDGRLREIDLRLEELQDLRVEIAHARDACDASLSRPQMDCCPVVDELAAAKPH